MRLLRPSRIALKTALLLAVDVLGNSFGNLELARGMYRMPPFSFNILGTFIVHLVLNPDILAGTALTATYTLAQLSLFSWADLSYVIPCTASTYVVSTLLGRFILGEAVDVQRWIGVAAISLGVILVAETPVATKTPQAGGTSPQQEGAACSSGS